MVLCCWIWFTVPLVIVLMRIKWVLQTSSILLKMHTTYWKAPARALPKRGHTIPTPLLPRTRFHQPPRHSSRHQQSNRPAGAARTNG